jgi:hypothetical protein
MASGSGRDYTGGMQRVGRACLLACAVVGILAAEGICAPLAGPATMPGGQARKLPHIELDLKRKCVRLECEAVNAQSPLEYFICAAGGAEHETVLRTRAKASNLHLALLLIGLNPGHPAQRAEASKDHKPHAPAGPRLRLTCEFIKDGKAVSLPADRLMRRIKDKRPIGPINWIFTGSQLLADGGYAADVTGHIVTAVNFPFSVIDVAELRSSANESLEWEVDPAAVPERNATVWLIIEAAGG